MIPRSTKISTLTKRGGWLFDFVSVKPRFYFGKSELWYLQTRSAAWKIELNRTEKVKITDFHRNFHIIYKFKIGETGKWRSRELQRRSKSNYSKTLFRHQKDSVTHCWESGNPINQEFIDIKLQIVCNFFWRYCTSKFVEWKKIFGTHFIKWL